MISFFLLLMVGTCLSTFVVIMTRACENLFIRRRIVRRPGGWRLGGGRRWPTVRRRGAGQVQKNSAQTQKLFKMCVNIGRKCIRDISVACSGCWCPVLPHPTKTAFCIPERKRVNNNRRATIGWLALAGWPARPGDRSAVPGRAHRSTQLI